MQMEIRKIGASSPLRTVSKGSISIESARHIMGENFFGMEEWNANFPDLTLFFDDRELQDKVQFPWDERILNAPCPLNPSSRIRETHFAFLGCGFGTYRGRLIRLSLAGMELLGKVKSGYSSGDAELLGLTALKAYEDRLARLYKLAGLRFSSPRNDWYLMPITQPPLSSHLHELREYKLASVSEYFMGLFLYYIKFHQLPDGANIYLSVDDESGDWIMTEVIDSRGFLEVKATSKISSSTPLGEINALVQAYILNKLEPLLIQLAFHDRFQTSITLMRT